MGLPDKNMRRKSPAPQSHPAKTTHFEGWEGVSIDVGRWTFIGAIYGFLAVALGAFGAHALKGRMSSANAAIYETAAHYHLTHALALLVTGICCALMPASAKLMNAASWLFAIGIVLFSGSLYALAIADQPILGAITPFGGLCFLAGWALLALAAFKAKGKG